jgi:outer membrane receptor protein involved in Fe transport
MKKLILPLLLLIAFKNSSAQVLKGNVKDSEGNPIAFTFVKVTNQALGAKTDLQGNYQIKFPQSGNFQVVFSNLNYKTITKNIQITEGQEIIENITLEAEAKKVKGAIIRGVKNKESEQAILLEQKQAVVIQEKIGAEEMSKKGAGDAAAAVTKMAGVTKSEGGDNGSIFVRGLGDRYNSTTLNGLYMSSNNPEFKNISLDIFSTDIIQSVSVSKTFNGNLSGDFGGAAVNISTKEYLSKPFLTVNVGMGMNSQAVSNDNYGSGMNVFGFLKNNDKPDTKINVTEGNNIVYNPTGYRYTAAYDERIQWKKEKRNLPRINNEFGFTGGTSYKFKNNKTVLGVFGTFNHANKFTQNEGVSNDFRSDGEILVGTNKTQTALTASQNAMLNATLLIDQNHKLRFNSIWSNTSSDVVSSYLGRHNFNGNDIYVERSTQDNNSLLINQLLGNHKILDRLEIDWGVAYNTLNSNQPYRKTLYFNEFNRGEANNYRILSPNVGASNIYYQDFSDEVISARANGKLTLGKKENESINPNAPKFNFGFEFTDKTRDFSALQYNYSVKTAAQNSNNVNENNIDQTMFGKDSFNAGAFDIRGQRENNGEVSPSTYSGNIQIFATTLGLDLKLNDKFSLSFGSKLEMINQNISYNVAAVPSGDVNRSDFEILPYVFGKYAINDKSNFKFGASKTYTLPQFKELAPFLYEDISTNNSFGNPHLYLSTNYNLDLKYEIFPTKNELYSITGFGKIIQNPINKAMVATVATGDFSYANTGDQAIVFGAEVEVKKNIFDQFETEKTFKSQLSTGVNLSVLYTHQDLNKDKVANENAAKDPRIEMPFTFTSSQLTGASPLILNADISYKFKYKKLEPTFTVVANYFMDKVYSLGVYSMNNIYEKGFITLDFISKLKISEKSNISLNVRNILNPDIDRYLNQNNMNLTASSFRRGIDFSIGYSYNIIK